MYIYIGEGDADIRVEERGGGREEGRKEWMGWDEGE